MYITGGCKMFAKRTKILFVLSLLFMMTMIFSAPAAVEAVEVNVQAPTIPAALPFLWMQEEGKIPAAFDFDLNLSSDHQRGMSLIAQNDIQFLVTGSNVAANAYNRGIDIKMININTWAIDYLLTNGFEAENWSDLKGKSLALPLQGGPLDFLARYLMQKNKVNPEDVNLVYRALPGAAQYFMAGNVDSILLPEPLVTVTLARSDNAVLSMDIQNEWAEIHGDQRIPFVGLFANGEFADNYPQFTKIFKGLYSQGVDWVNQNPDQAAELAAENFNMPAPLLKKSMQRVNLNIYSDQESREVLELYFSEILDIYPEMLGGNMIDEEFYF